MNNIVKIPHNLFQRSRELNVQKDVEFFYALKRIDSTGFISKDSLIKKVGRFVKLTHSSIYRRITSLINLGLLKRVKNGYRICSYKKFLTVLGCKQNAYDKMIVRDDQKILLFSAIREIKQNFKEQAIAASSSIKNTEYQRSFSNTRGLLLHRFNEVVEDKLAYMVDQNIELEETQRYAQVTQSSIEINHCNPDVTLSYQAIARLRNLKSTSQSFDLMNELEELRLVRIQRDRLVLVEQNVSYQKFLIKYGEERFRYRGRDAYKVLPNKYYF